MRKLIIASAVVFVIMTGCSSASTDSPTVEVGAFYGGGSLEVYVSPTGVPAEPTPKVSWIEKVGEPYSLYALGFGEKGRGMYRPNRLTFWTDEYIDAFIEDITRTGNLTATLSTVKVVEALDDVVSQLNEGDSQFFTGRSIDFDLPTTVDGNEYCKRIDLTAPDGVQKARLLFNMNGILRSGERMSDHFVEPFDINYVTARYYPYSNPPVVACVYYVAHERYDKNVAGVTYGSVGGLWDQLLSMLNTWDGYYF